MTNIVLSIQNKSRSSVVIGCGLTRQPGADSRSPTPHLQQWDRKENGQKVKLVGSDKNTLIRQ